MALMSTYSADENKAPRIALSASIDTWFVPLCGGGVEIQHAPSECVQLLLIGCSSIPPTVVSDKEHLRQVLINLLANAIKFTPEGSVTLRVSQNAVWVESQMQEKVSPP
jgi:signal transduction histidine kinase